MATEVAPSPLMAPSRASPQLTPRKRNHEGNFVNHPFSTLPAEQSSPLSEIPSPLASQGRRDRSTPLSDLGPTPILSPTKADDMAPKKPKMSFFEKQADKQIKQTEKEEKDRLKAEAKAKKEEEKTRKDEEKKRKEEEREALRKVKEEKKREKDEEKQAKEAEALKKERAQMRLGAFFGKSAAASTPPAFSDCEDVSRGTTTPRRNSITSIDLDVPLVDIKPSPLKHTLIDERPFIMPFFVKEHMQLAPSNRFLSNTAFLSGALPLNQEVVLKMLDLRFHKRRRQTRNIRPIKQILNDANGSESAPIDLTNTAVGPLGSIPYKYLCYREDIRPAYQGTFTKVVSPKKARKLAIRPSYRGLPNTDYDYDSEAEWAEPEEGDEEVLDDDEKSVDEDGDEEMDDFLDDEGEQVKRHLLVGEMEPRCSGLYWEGESNSAPPGFDLSTYRMDVLHDSTRFPIDPYSTAHWMDIGKKSPIKSEARSPMPAIMQPPRAPLTAVDPNGGKVLIPSVYAISVPHYVQSENNVTVIKPKLSNTGKAVKSISPEVLPAFRNAVSGSTLTKVGLLEVLKTQFPKCTKDAIKHTVESIAERRGAKGDEKRWVLIER